MANKMVSLKMVVATRMDKSVLGINIQYIENFKIHINTIGIIQLKKRHTAQFLKDEVINCLRQFNIDILQIYSSTTDNGANVLKASKLLKNLQEETQTRTVADDVEPLDSPDNSNDGDF